MFGTIYVLAFVILPKKTKTIIQDTTTISNSGKKSFLSSKETTSLLFCLIMDAIGLASFLLPALGEWTDVFWAPISGLIFMRTFGGMTGAVGGVINMVEELIPFTDFIPTFTIGYIYTRWYKNKKKF